MCQVAVGVLYLLVDWFFFAPYRRLAVLGLWRANTVVRFDRSPPSERLVQAQRQVKYLS